eukprot:gene7822-12295_t
MTTYVFNGFTDYNIIRKGIYLAVVNPSKVNTLTAKIQRVEYLPDLKVSPWLPLILIPFACLMGTNTCIVIFLYCIYAKYFGKKTKKIESELVDTINEDFEDDPAVPLDINYFQKDIKNSTM